jgi:hypothetical protein
MSTPDRMSHPQGGERPGPDCFGPDYYAEPVADAANHFTEMNTDHQSTRLPHQRQQEMAP